MTEVPLSFPVVEASPALKHVLTIYGQERTKRQEAMNKLVSEATQQLSSLMCEYLLPDIVMNGMMR